MLLTPLRTGRQQLSHQVSPSFRVPATHQPVPRTPAARAAIHANLDLILNAALLTFSVVPAYLDTAADEDTPEFQVQCVGWKVNY